MVLDLDLSRSNTLPEDYDTDLESLWANPSRISHLISSLINIFCKDLFVNENDFSSESIAKGRNFYYQKQIADYIDNQRRKTVSLLTSSLNIHLNLNQHSTINTSSVFMSLETISTEFLPNKTIGNIQIQLPSNISWNKNNNQTISIRVCFI